MYQIIKEDMAGGLELSLMCYLSCKGGDWVEGEALFIISMCACVHLSL